MDRQVEKAVQTEVRPEDTHVSLLRSDSWTIHAVAFRKGYTLHIGPVEDHADQDKACVAEEKENSAVVHWRLPVEPPKKRTPLPPPLTVVSAEIGSALTLDSIPYKQSNTSDNEQTLEQHPDPQGYAAFLCRGAEVLVC